MHRRKCFNTRVRMATEKDRTCRLSCVAAGGISGNIVRSMDMTGD